MRMPPGPRAHSHTRLLRVADRGDAHPARAAGRVHLQAWTRHAHSDGDVASEGAAGFEGVTRGAAAVGADLDFVDDEDFVCGEGGDDDGPEYGDAGGEDGDVDFEDGEDVDAGGEEGGVEDGGRADAFYAEGDEARDAEGYDAGRVLDEVFGVWVEGVWLE